MKLRWRTGNIYLPDYAEDKNKIIREIRIGDEIFRPGDIIDITDIPIQFDMRRADGVLCDKIVRFSKLDTALVVHTEHSYTYVYRDKYYCSLLKTITKCHL